MENDNLEKNCSDLKNKVMGEIKKKKIKMSCPSAILAKKLGLEGGLIFSIICGALLVSIFLYFLKKTRLIRFVELGFPGLKIFLSTIPYDYIALFILVMIAAIYFANKLDLSYERKIPDNLFTSIFLAASIIVGLFFVFLGVHEAIKGWSKNRIPRESAIVGRVVDFSPGEFIIQEEDGELVKVELRREAGFDNGDIDIRGKFMRAVGDRDKKNPSYFDAESILCCDDD